MSVQIGIKKKEKVSLNKRVEIINKAISSKNGKQNFMKHRLQEWRLLEIGDLSKKIMDHSKRVFVETSTLDKYIKKELDILWIDVQGAEKLVLRAQNT